MKNFFNEKQKSSSLKLLLLALLFCAFLPFFSGCKKELDYFHFVSELRSNILLAEADGISLRVYAVKREQPYASDGVPRESSQRLEAYLVTPEGDKSCVFNFKIDGREYGGDMSFDNVKTEYYYFCSLDISDLTELNCIIEYGDQVFELTARSVLDGETLSPETALNTLKATETELFSSLTDTYGFAGEIYLRLIYEEAPYYYIGVIDRNGNVNAFLMNAKTGKIIAKRLN